MYTKSRAFAALPVALLMMCGGCEMESDMKLQSMNTNERGVAVGGYDVVSYFDGNAEPGSTEHTHVWRGAKFLFATPEHQAAFADAPERYAPQYGGYCSFGMGFGTPAAADPEAFDVQDGRLYLNASPMVRRFWRWFGNPEKSNAKWRALKAEAGLP